MGPAVDNEVVSRNTSDTGDSFLDDGIVYWKNSYKKRSSISSLRKV